MLFILLGSRTTCSSPKSFVIPINCFDKLGATPPGLVFSITRSIIEGSIDYLLIVYSITVLIFNLETYNIILKKLKTSDRSLMTEYIYIHLRRSRDGTDGRTEFANGVPSSVRRVRRPCAIQFPLSSFYTDCPNKRIL